MHEASCLDTCVCKRCLPHAAGLVRRHDPTRDAVWRTRGESRGFPLGRLPRVMQSLYSSVAERQSCKLKVLGSIPSGGYVSAEWQWHQSLMPKWRLEESRLRPWLGRRALESSVWKSWEEERWGALPGSPLRAAGDQFLRHLVVDS